MPNTQNTSPQPTTKFQQVPTRNWRETSRYRVTIDGEYRGTVIGKQGSLLTVTMWTARRFDGHVLNSNFDTRAAAAQALARRV